MHFVTIEPVTEAVTEPEVVTVAATEAEVQTEVANEAVPASTVESTSGNKWKQTLFYSEYCNFDSLSILFRLATFSNLSLGCCAKVKVHSEGIGKGHYWAMGTFERSDRLEKIALGSKTIYMQNKTPENADQYYLEGSKNGGWKVNFTKVELLSSF